MSWKRALQAAKDNSHVSKKKFLFAGYFAKTAAEDRLINIRGLARYFHIVKCTPQSTNFHRRIDDERTALFKTERCKPGNVKNVLRGVVLLKFFQRSRKIYCTLTVGKPFVIGLVATRIMKFKMGLVSDIPICSQRIFRC